MKKIFRYLLLMGFLTGIILLLNGNIDLEEDNSNAITIGFYNVENLFDTINDPEINDDKFLPQSKARWTTQRYLRKVDHLSKVIDQMGDSNGPEILGLCEVENKEVLQDLLRSVKLKSKGYQIIQYNSKDQRGIDAAVIYKAEVFKPYASVAKTVIADGHKKLKTRDVLVVSGKLKNDTIHLLVNHWPSRLGGQEKSEPNRIHVATYVRSIIDSLLNLSAHAKIIVMGDFNDEPSNKSIYHVLKAKDELNKCGLNDLYNPFYKIMQEGGGTYKYEGQWDLLDQILVSRAMMDGKKFKYKLNSADIYDPIWMYYKESMHHGPFRTYMGSKYYGGYSDHFPVYLQLTPN